MRVGEICTRSVVVIEKSASVLDAARRMRLDHVGDLVVVQPTDGRLVPIGIVTDRDLVVGVMALELRYQESLTVGDVMSADLVVAREDESVTDVLGKMRAGGIRRVPVVNEAGELVGLLTFDDLVELLAEQLGLLAQLVPRQATLEREERR